MILSRPLKIFLLVACVALAGARAADVDLEKAVGSLIAAEKAYAKLAGEKGFRDASISVFGDDAVIFAPGAVNGKKFWPDAKENPIITWRPLSLETQRKWRWRALAPDSPGGAARGRAVSITFSESRAESNRPANQDARHPGDTHATIPRKN
jgi:hypothetical protein